MPSQFLKQNNSLELTTAPWLSFWLSGEEFPCNAGDAGDTGLISGSGRSPGGKGNPLQFSCQESPMDRRAGPATVHGVTRIRQD